MFFTEVPRLGAMWECRAVVMVEEGLADGVADAVKKEYPRSSMVHIEHLRGTTCATLHIRTRETCNAVDARLQGMPGISVLSVSDTQADLPPKMKTRSFWMVVSMSAACAGFFAVGFVVPDNPILLLNPAQMLVIQTVFTLAVAVLVYLRDREAARHAAERADRVYTLAQEINERIKIIEEKGR